LSIWLLLVGVVVVLKQEAAVVLEDFAQELD
jgi:hypothetical protein